MFGLPFRPNKSWWTIFCMFPYSSTASVFSLSWTKAHYVVNDGIASKFKQLWLHDIKKSDILVVSFDESLNQATQSSEIEMDTNYYVFIEHEVKVKYIGSSFMGHWTHEDLIELFKNLIEDVELKKSAIRPFKFQRQGFCKKQWQASSLLCEYWYLEHPHCTRRF